MIADSARLSVGYAKRLLEGVAAADFSKFARVGGQVIQSNHPAFVLGHLSLYPARIVSELGHDASAIVPSDRETELFAPTAVCVDDPEGAIYPRMDVIFPRFLERYEAVMEILQTADDSQFIVENPNERMREKFATMGSMHAFYLGGHTMIHLGQLSAWRRAMGMPAA